MRIVLLLVKIDVIIFGACVLEKECLVQSCSHGCRAIVTELLNMPLLSFCDEMQLNPCVYTGDQGLHLKESSIRFWTLGCGK